MRRTSKLFIIVLLSILIFPNCKKQPSTFSVYFYTSKTVSETKLDLFIEDQYKGELPNLIGKPQCNASDTLKKECLFIGLKSGKYKIVARDKQGSIISSGTIKFKRNSVHTSGDIGGIELTSDDDCLIVGLF